MDFSRRLLNGVRVLFGSIFFVSGFSTPIMFATFAGSLYAGKPIELMAVSAVIVSASAATVYAGWLLFAEVRISEKATIEIS